MYRVGKRTARNLARHDFGLKRGKIIKTLVESDAAVPHQARALGRADTSPYQRVRFARPESTVGPTTAPSPSATIAVISAIV